MRHIIVFTAIIFCMQLWLGCFSMTYAEQIDKVKLEEAYFEKIQLTPSGLKLTFKSSGTRFLCRIDKGDLVKTEYGQSIIVPFGATLELNDRHGKLLITSPPASARAILAGKSGWVGFLVKEERDERSVGRGLKKNEAILTGKLRRDSAGKAIAGEVYIAPDAEALKILLQAD